MLCSEIRYVIAFANLGVILLSILVLWSYLYHIQQGLPHGCCHVHEINSICEA